jgi:manganese transport system permease protein
LHNVLEVDCLSIRFPSATAKRLARNLTQMLVLAVGIAVVATVAGTWLASWLHRATGPFIVIVAAACFLLSFLRR